MNSQRLSKNVELEKIILNKLPNHLKNIFQKKFSKNDSGYWQKISEARAVVVFNDLGILIKEIDSKTFKNKDVDFLAIFENEKIYTEVKGFIPEDYEIAKKGGTLGTDDNKINRALDRAQIKFLDLSFNILVIADEDTIKPPLFMNPLMDLEKTPETYLNNPDYVKTSAIMVLGGLFEDQLFKFKIWYSANPQKSLPKNLLKKFDQKKCNIY